MTTFCAHCVREAPDCKPVSFDGREVLMCGECREGPVRGGNYSFSGEGEAGKRKHRPLLGGAWGNDKK